jgi:L-threonylcarbamoyladenylate synthase
MPTPDTIARLREIKHRDRDKPFIYLMPNVGFLERFGIDARSYSLKWPGPFTYVFPNDMAIRVPDHALLISVMVALDSPLISTSANLSGEAFARGQDDVSPDILKAIDFVYPAPNLILDSPSEIWDVRVSPPVRLR